MNVLVQVIILFLVFFMNVSGATANISGSYIPTNILWDNGSEAYNKGKKDQNKNRNQKAVENYVSALAYLSAYYQRRPELAGSNSKHAKSVRKLLAELTRFLSRLSATADIKGDDWAGGNVTGFPPAPGGNLANPPKQTRSSATFTNPRFRGSRLDWCRSRGAECGKPAAIAFCKRHGFTRVTKFQIDNNIGKSTPTKIISSKEICNKKHCDGFKHIMCTQ